MKFHKLGEVCIISKGESITRATTTEGNVPVIAGGLGPAYFHNTPNRKPPVITISASGANAGFVNLWELPIWASDCTTITEKSDSPVLIGYIYRYLQSKQNFINTKLRRGSAQPHVYPSDIAEIEIPLPSLKRQSEIIEKLDKAFAEIDKLEMNLGFSKDNVTQLWQSVLRSTFTGQTDFQEAGELSTSRVFREETIEEICNVEYGTRVVRKRDAGTLYPVYGGGGETFFIDSFNREDRVVIARFALSEKCTRRVFGKFALNDSGLTLSPKDPKVLRQDYLDYFILSMNDQIYESARGTAQKNLDVPAFRRMKVVYHTSSETQMAIVQKLDSVFREIEAMRNKLKIKSDRLIELRKSLLHHAFNTFEEVA